MTAVLAFALIVAVAGWAACWHRARRAEHETDRLRDGLDEWLAEIRSSQ